MMMVIPVMVMMMMVMVVVMPTPTPPRRIVIVMVMVVMMIVIVIIITPILGQLLPRLRLPALRFFPRRRIGGPELRHRIWNRLQQLRIGLGARRRLCGRGGVGWRNGCDGESAGQACNFLVHVHPKKLPEAKHVSFDVRLDALVQFEAVLWPLLRFCPVNLLSIKLANLTYKLETKNQAIARAAARREAVAVMNAAWLQARFFADVCAPSV